MRNPKKNTGKRRFPDLFWKLLRVKIFKICKLQLAHVHRSGLVKYFCILVHFRDRSVGLVNRLRSLIEMEPTS